MDGFLKQSTAGQVRWIGPFVDDTDFKTAETALTVANTDIKVSKNGAASASKNSGGGTHDVNGMYAVTWDATDSATVGELKYSVKVAGALQVFGSYVVLEEAVYDALFGASALGYIANAPVNVAQFGGSNGAFAGGRPEVNTSHVSGTVQTAGDVIADTNDIQARLPAALTADGNIKADTLRVGGTLQTAGDLVALINAVDNFVDNELSDISTLLTSTGVVLTAAQTNVIRDAIFARAFSAAYGSHTFDELTKMMSAVLLGVMSGLDTGSIVVRNLADSANVLTATGSAEGNRSAITRTP